MIATGTTVSTPTIMCQCPLSDGSRRSALARDGAFPVMPIAGKPAPTRCGCPGHAPSRPGALLPVIAAIVWTAQRIFPGREADAFTVGAHPGATTLYR
ncbi:MAG: hypothetical protein EOO78_25525 [Oxalobacteraceae bacterium]|nr:MAG: hypothetical protein EOO78_25525 [Oxalobacteraceae bacterium]